MRIYFNRFLNWFLGERYSRQIIEKYSVDGIIPAKNIDKMAFELGMDLNKIRKELYKDEIK